MRRGGSDRVTRFFYPIFYVQIMVAILFVAYFAQQAGGSDALWLPIAWDTPYHVLRSIVSIGMLTFTLLFIIRHVVLVVCATADEVERSSFERRLRKLDVEPFQPLVSIIVPAYNEGIVIEASIRSLLALDYPAYEVIVIDDGSSDDTLTRAQTLEGQHGPANVQVFWKPNGGKASALNYGIERAAGEFCVTVDSDSVLEPQTLKEAVRHMQDPIVGAVAGKVVVANTVNLWTRLQALEYLKGLNLVRKAQSFVRAVSIVPGPIGMFRKSALRAVGGYETDTFAEDCDLTLKLLCDGWKIAYEPRAVSHTEAPEDILSLTKQRYRWTRGILQSIKKHWRFMLTPSKSLTGAMVLWYQAFEAFCWPVLTMLSVAFLAFSGFDATLRPAVAYLWLQLMLLDLAVALFCVGVEEQDLDLVLYTPVDRIVFQIMLDIGKLLATVEELLGIRMGWGKLERKGKI
ncbi:MAG: glycosyltransferase family 2 protein [Myxococcales bacterium]|nr:glycosyltransferase family 2 protein [Myxococcales bacterium]